MRKTFQKIFIVIAVCAPVTIFAAPGDVVINEIAWSGTKADDTDEWIELKNNIASEVMFDGWQVRAKDGAPIIPLSGAISAGGFYLIERTADSVVNDVVGDYVGPFGKNGSIENSGEDLELVDASGAVVDSVLFFFGWSAGTAGPDYFSMERVDPKKDGSLASNWATNNGVKINGTDAADNPINGTPKQENSVALSQTPSSSSSVSSYPALSSSLSVSPSHPMYPSLGVDAGPDRTVLVGSSVSFSSLALGINNAPLLDGRFLWNFGDGVAQEGRALEHIYYFSGTYTVALTVSSGPYSGFDAAVITAIVPALSVKSMQTGEDGFVVVASGSDARIDLGGMIVRDSAGAQFLIPKNTFVLPKGEVTFPNRVSGLLKSGSAAALYDAVGREVRAAQSTTDNKQQATQPPAVSGSARTVIEVSPPTGLPGGTPKGGETANVQNEIVVREAAPVPQKEIAAVSSARVQYADEQAPQNAKSGISKTSLFFGASVLVGMLSAAGFFLLKNLF